MKIIHTLQEWIHLFSSMKKKDNRFSLFIIFSSHSRNFLLCYMKILIRYIQFINKMKILLLVILVVLQLRKLRFIDVYHYRNTSMNLTIVSKSHMCLYAYLLQKDAIATRLSASLSPSLSSSLPPFLLSFFFEQLIILKQIEMFMTFNTFISLLSFAKLCGMHFDFQRLFCQTGFRATATV